MCVRYFLFTGYSFVIGLIVVSQISGIWSDKTKCLEDKHFYRDPDRPTHAIWTPEECSKYFLCLENEVFEFKCSTGLLFDVNRQICDFRNNVDNCDITTEITIPQPLLEEANCTDGQLGCADGTCLPQNYFCDGSQDCPDASDEADCDIFIDPNTAKECDLNNCNLPECFCSKDEITIPQPLLEEANCTDGQLGCADGTCLPQNYFCDGSQDCPDASDEADCDIFIDPNTAKECDLNNCNLPECFCSKDGKDIPDEMSPAIIPQMVLLTFDDAINDDNWELYNDLLNFHNPNGCPIGATFFVSHQFNNYHYTQKLWNDGHEIGIHSITHRGPEDWWSYNATIEDWFDEMIGQANILNKFAKVRLQEIRGLRVPFLRTGWNRQFLMMKEFGFVYDSSLIAPLSNPPLWPFTLDYKIPFDCLGNHQLCPTRAYTGIWELPMNPLEAGDYICIMVDSCASNLTGNEIHDMLMHNFKRHYLTNKAPFGLYFHSTWFKNDSYLKAFKKFLNNILKKTDVWFVTNWQAVEWMKNPTSLDKLYSFRPWKCNRPLKKSEKNCEVPNRCKLYSRVFQEEREMITCMECPPKYPWIRNEFGLN